MDLISFSTKTSQNENINPIKKKKKYIWFKSEVWKNISMYISACIYTNRIYSI